jgi:hypothetical protein
VGNHYPHNPFRWHLHTATIRGGRAKATRGTTVLSQSTRCAVPVAVLVISLLLFLVPLGGLIAWVLAFCFNFALIGACFDLDLSGICYCVIVIFLIRLAVALAVAWLGGVEDGCPHPKSANNT